MNSILINDENMKILHYKIKNMHKTKGRGKPRIIELWLINTTLRDKWYNKMSWALYCQYKKKWFTTKQMIDAVIAYRNKKEENTKAFMEYKLKWWQKTRKQFVETFRAYYKKYNSYQIALQKTILLDNLEYTTETFKRFKEQYPESKIMSVILFRKLYEDYEFDEIAKLPISIYWKELLNKKWFYTLKQDIRYVFTKNWLIRFLDKYKNLDWLIKSDRFKYNKICYFFNYFWEKYISRRNYKWKDIHIKRKEQVERILKQIDIQAFYNNWDWDKYLKKIIENDTIYEINEFWNKIELCKL